MFVLLALFTAIPLFPENSYLEMAYQFWMDGEYSKAESFYLKAAKDNSLEYDSRLGLAALYRAQGDYRSAVKQYNILISKKPALDQKAITDLYIPLAESFYYSNHLKESVWLYHKILEVSPDLPEALFGLGRALFRNGEIEQAEHVLRSALSVDSSFPGNYIYLAKIAELKNDPEEAIDYFIKAQKQDKYQVELLYYMGIQYQALGHFEKAFRQFHRLNNIDSGNSYVRAKITEIRPHLTRTEEEIITAKVLDKFKTVEPITGSDKIPIVRVGLNTTTGGKSVPLKTLSFMSSGDFSITDGTSIIFSGKSNYLYSIVLNNGHPVIYGNQEYEAQKPDDKPSTDADLIGKSVFEAELPGRFYIEQTPAGQGSFIIKKIDFARGFAWGGIEDRQYRGRLEVAALNNGLRLINEVNLEEYLYSVVPSEMMISFPEEALKAQAVIARSYALYRMKYIHPHGKDGFDICDSQHCQVYKGASNEWRKSSEAINETRGHVLYYDGKVSHPLYHSNCGGHTQSSKDLKGWGDVEYLTGVFDGSDDLNFPISLPAFESWIKSSPNTYCNIKAGGWDPEFRWFRLMPADLLHEKILREKDIGNIQEILVVKRNPAGYVHSVRITGTKGSITIEKEHRIRRLLGVGPLRSNLFWIETKYDERGLPEEYTIFGGGWGHGVGLCQDGSAGMAKRGLSYKEILEHYYKDTYIERMDY
jgi:SpoIID/LytB domain protein